jgi:tRNA-splicing ligase RtcB
MPDMHWGYGFPIGGVAATDVEAGGVVSPGGVGFDISCGVRLLVSDLDSAAIAPRLEPLMDLLDAAIPRGMTHGATWRLTGEKQLDEILAGGVAAALAHGHAQPADLERCEDHGTLAEAEPGQVSARARERGLGQVGSLGSGNHFLEVQVVDQVYAPAAAEAYGLVPGRVCVMIHTGSRGLGHQICTDFVRRMQKAMAGYGVTVPDRQLACVPVNSPEGAAYLGAMAAAANYARVNRQLLAEAARRAFAQATGHDRLDLVYDVSHNLAKIETASVQGATRRLCVHRKGATRAFPPGHAELPGEFARTGQPVLVPGSMGTASYVLAGVAGAPAFASACHGAGRTLSRHQAQRRTDARALRASLARAGVMVRGASARGLVEETPEAYKDIDAVVEVCAKAGLAAPVARLRPIGVVKG